MKTEGMPHQMQYLRKAAGRTGYANFSEQGTGKTWSFLAEAERFYATGKIDAVFVVAPNGVHTNWALREIPEHLGVPSIVRCWRAGGGVRHRESMNDLFEPREDGKVPPLRILCMNYEALGTRDGFDFAQRFAIATKCMAVADESVRIKSPEALTTKRLMRLQHLFAIRRIGSGLPITNNPADVFPQMEFLEEGLLGTTSYHAFFATYAELIDRDGEQFKRMVARNPKVARAHIVARNEDGTPKWKNLDRLHRRLEPNSFRVLKKDCLKLPPKIYKTRYFDLDASQQRAYRLLENELRIQLDAGDVAPVSALAALVKLQQVTSGYVIRPDTREVMYVSKNNPRLAALLEAVEEIDGKVLIWARFREELRAIAGALRFKYGVDAAVEYHGDVKAAEREAAVDGIQKGAARFFIGQAQSGGIGLTLTAAETSIYYSNDFSLGNRAQSEDRNHRKGTRNEVVYIDIVAFDSIDESIASALQRKASMAAQILGDRRLRVTDEMLDSELAPELFDNSRP